jgi:O-antigen/teichoic acid export membrane protein
VLEKAINKYRSLSLPVKAGLWFTICSILQRGISVISMPIFTRLLSTEEYGSYSLYISWTMLFGMVITLNLQQEVFNKGLSDHTEERPQYSTSQAVLISVLVLGFYIVYLLLQNPINGLTGMDTLLTSLMFLEIYSSAIVSLWLARRRFEYAYKPLVLVTLGISIASVGIGVVAVWLAPTGWKVVARVASNVLPYLIVAIYVFIIFLGESKSLYNRKWWSRSVRMGIPLLPHYASQVLLNQADKVIISWFLDNTKVAIYSVAHSAGLLLVMVNNGINSSFVPWLYEKLRNNDCRPIAGVTNILILIVVLLVFLLMLLAPECVAILATSDYYDAIWCIPPIATSVVFTFMYTLFVNVEIYYGKPGYVAIASILAAVVNVALNLVAIPVFGYIASAYVTAVCYLGTAILHYFFMIKALKGAGVDSHIFDYRFMLFATALTILCAAVSLFLYSAGIARYIFIALLLILTVIFRKPLISTIRDIRKKG